MKVLQFGKFFPPDIGGMETFMFDLTEELSRKIKCDVLCSNSKNKTLVEKRDNYIVTRAASLGRILSTSLSPAMIYQLKMIGNNYDVIHMHLPDPMAALAFFLVRPKSKLVLHWQSDIVRQKFLLKIYEPLQYWLLKRADRIIATSPKYATDSIYLDKYKNKCVIISLGINPNKLTADNEKVAATKNKYRDKPIILFVGRLIYYKGIEYLVEAMRDVDGYLLIIGGGPLKDKIRDLIEKLALTKKVFLLGRIEDDDLGSYYKACDLLCLPSIHKSEAYGLVQLEAMNFGKPVVSTIIKGSGVDWVNQSDITGLTVEPKNPKALAGALNKIIQDPGRGKILGQNGKTRFEREFNIKITAARINNLYREILRNQ